MVKRLKDITFNFIPVAINRSQDPKIVRSAVISLYKAWYRQLPIIIYDYKLAITNEEARSKLREIFVRNSRIQDPKMISSLVLKGEMELNESVNKQKEECHLWKYFRSEPRGQKDFLSKFLEGS